MISTLFWLSVLVILYAYFGYPLLVFVLARLIPRNLQPGETATPSTTLLIAAYNEEDIIEKKLRNAQALDFPRDRLQILVVTDGSSDSTPRLVEDFSGEGVQLMHRPERGGKMAAINRALPQARGEIIVFSDANNFYLPDTLRQLTEPFNDPEVGGASGAKVIDQGDGSLGASEGLYWKYESFIKKQESRLGSCTSAAGEILAIRKKAYRKPPDNIINDDFYLAMQVIRQGYRFVYVPGAVSHERVSMTAKDEITRRTRINAGRYQAMALASQIVPFNKPLLVWQIFSHKFLRPLIPFFMISAVLFNVAAVIFPPADGAFGGLGRPWGAILLSLQALFYGLAWLGSRVGARGRLGKLLYLPTFLTNSNLAALQGLAKYLRGGNAHIWERIQRGPQADE